LLGQLVRIRKQFPRHVVRVVYEASYIGFTLQRDLEEKGIHCDVVAPSSIPRQGGKAVKTDRIDATQLAQFYANDLLTIVQVPELEM
jgi:transposase